MREDKIGLAASKSLVTECVDALLVDNAFGAPNGRVESRRLTAALLHIDIEQFMHMVFQATTRAARQVLDLFECQQRWFPRAFWHRICLQCRAYRTIFAGRVPFVRKASELTRIFPIVHWMSFHVR